MIFKIGQNFERNLVFESLGLINKGLEHKSRGLLSEVICQFERNYEIDL